MVAQAKKVEKDKAHPGRYVSVPRAAEMLGVSPRTVGRMIDDGTLATVRPRGHRRVSVESIAQQMAADSADGLPPLVLEEDLLR